mgnify:CR=1 FL=1
MKKVIAMIIWMLLCHLPPAWAVDDVSVTLRLDRTEATLSDTVKMEIHISGTRSSDGSPVVQGLESFLVTKGGTSNRVEIINGKINSGVDYTYYIQPQKTGIFKVGPAVINVNKIRIESNSATLTVSSAPQASRSDRGPVFMDASVSSQDFYVDQHVLYTLKLYYRTNIGNLSLNLPEIEYVTFKQLERPLEYQSTYAGMSYQVLEVRHALTVSMPGDFVIHPSRMNMTVRQSSSRSLFDNFFNDSFSGFSSGRPLAVKTDSIHLHVKALSDEGKPANCTGLVGTFRMESTLEPASLQAGESATLTVQVKGQGTVNRIPDLDLPEMEFVRTYRDQPVLETEQSRQGITGTKTMKWALVPENAGEFKIPVLSLSFFNPETKNYHEMVTPSHVISDLPGKTKNDIATLHPLSTAANNAERSVKKEIQKLGEDILPIHTQAADLTVPFRFLYNGWLFWIVLAGPPFMYLMLLGSFRIKRLAPGRLAQSKSKKAFSVFKNRCQKNQANYEDLLNAFKCYLNDRFNLSFGTLTPDDTERILRDQGVAAATAKKIYTLIQQLEATVYKGNNTDDTDAAGDLLDVVKLIEKEIS